MKQVLCLIEVISGCEGPCLSIGNENGGRRIAGPKPWGGGRTIHSFEVSVEEIKEALKPYEEYPKDTGGEG